MNTFEDIYRRYFDYVFGFIMNLTGSDRQLAEELTQETFCQAWVSLERFRGDCQLGTWLCQISKNCWLKYLRKNRSACIELPPDAVSELNLEQNFIDHEQKTTLRHEILALKPKHRDVMILRLYYNLSYEEIQQVTGISKDTAKVYYQRGKDQLTRRLKHK